MAFVNSTAKAILCRAVPWLPKSSSTHFLNQTNHGVKPNGQKCVSRADAGPTFLAHFSSPELVSEAESDFDFNKEYEEEARMVGNGQTAPPVLRRRRRYRKEYPGEKKGISEEMRFVAMKLRNMGKRKTVEDSVGVDSERDGEESENDDENRGVSSALDTDKQDGDDNSESWEPTIEGLLKYLVDSELVFSTIERIVDDSSDVSYVYFRKTGLERSDSISKDLEWFRQQGNEIPRPSFPGITYARYLQELADKSPPLFLSHFYNIYFSHIAGGQVITKQVSKRILEGKELEFNRWEGNEQELLQGIRRSLNALGEHWSRDEKNRCLSEATKAYRFQGQIIRLIILLQ